MNITYKGGSNFPSTPESTDGSRPDGAGRAGGRWVFVPLAKWETLPPCFYSLRVAAVLLRLVGRVGEDDLNFAMRYRLLPPPGLRGRTLEAWLDGARAGVGRELCDCERWRRPLPLSA